MPQDNDNVVRFPAWRSAGPLPGFSRLESDRLVGRAFLREGAQGNCVGIIVSTYAIGEKQGRSEYGLNTEFKFLDSGAVWKGTLNRCDLERTKKTMLLRQGLTNKVKDLLKTTEKPSEDLLMDLHAEVYAAYHTRAPGEPGITL